MKIVSFIDEEDVIRDILKHCNLWKKTPSRSPPNLPIPDTPTGLTYDTEFISTSSMQASTVWSADFPF